MGMFLSSTRVFEGNIEDYLRFARQLRAEGRDDDARKWEHKANEDRRLSLVGSAKFEELVRAQADSGQSV